MQDNKKTIIATVEQAITPVVNCQITFSEQRLILNEMFSMALCNAPENETENFSAKRFSPFFMAISEMLENLDKIPQIAMDNHMMLLDKE